MILGSGTKKSAVQSRGWRASFTISQDMVNDQGYGNDLKLIEFLEREREGVCGHLGFGSSNSVDKVELGLFMRKREYRFLRKFFLNDRVEIIPTVRFNHTVIWAVLRCYLNTTKGILAQPSIEAFYEMNFEKLDSREPVAIPLEIVDAIAQFNKPK